MSHLTDTQSVYLGSDPRRVDWLVELPVVSGCHCRLFLRDGDIWIEDLGSTNGTFVHGRRLDPNTPVEVAADAIASAKGRFALPLKMRMQILWKGAKDRSDMVLGKRGCSLVAQKPGSLEYTRHSAR